MFFSVQCKGHPWKKMPYPFPSQLCTLSVFVCRISPRNPEGVEFKNEYLLKYTRCNFRSKLVTFKFHTF